MKPKSGEPLANVLSSVTEKRLILASASPRRREILRLYGVPFEVRVSSAEPTLGQRKTPEATARHSAEAKALDIASRHPHRLVLGADTVVALGGQMLGKPRDVEEAWAMLRTLSGNQHQVYTAVVLAIGDGTAVHIVDLKTVSTDIWFRNLDEAAIEWYVSTGEPFDKAGAYGIQGEGGKLIAGISGSYYNVVGLPIGEVFRMLRRVGWRD